MRSRIFTCLGLFFLLLLPQLVIAQISRPGAPLSVHHKSIIPAPVVSLSHNLLEKAKFKAEGLNGLKPALFAWPIDTLIDVFDAVNQTILPDGSEIYRVEIESRGAYSLNIIFSKFNLPDGVSVFIYSPDLETVRGAYTSLNNKKSGKLATTPVPGDRIIVELDIPAGIIGFDPDLTIGRISHDFSDPFGFKTGFGTSGDCNVDINCPEGDDWQVEKRSVVKIIRGGFWLGSGALINNTSNDGRAMIYTANHVIANQGQAESTVYYFNYESPECDGPNGRLDQSVSGSDMLATTSRLDFALLELSKIPPLDYEVYYAGWNRAVGASNNNVTCIHHPSGDVKKISKCLGVIVTGNFGSGFDENTHWRIPEWNLGTTEGGSSGSPLFDQDHNIIGDLTGGDADCDYNFNDYFQKLFVCWDRYSDIGEQLKYWLDPIDNGAIVWNGFDPSTAGFPVANFKYSASSPKVGKEIRFDDDTEGQPASWEWSFENGSPSSSTLENPIVTFEQSGEYKVKLVVTNSFGKDSMQQTIDIIDFTGFKADQNRIVAGASIDYTDLSSGDPLSHQWVFEGGFPASWSDDNPSGIRYETPGTYDVSMIIEYPDFTDTVFYRDFIKVEPESLFFAGEGVTSFGKNEALGVIELEGMGWIAGNNTIGIDAFSNAFLISTDTVRMATGLRIPIGMMPDVVDGTYLSAVIWDDEFNEIVKDSVELSNDIFPDYQTVWFQHPVGIDSLIHAGFIVPEFPSGVFCSMIATPRTSSEVGAAFARHNGEWIGLNEAAGLISDLGVILETELLFPDFKSQIKLHPVITQDKIYIDLSNLVYEKFDVHLYDILGKQLISDYALFDNYLEMDFLAPVSGMYLLVLKLDNYSFTKKLILLKNQ